MQFLLIIYPFVSVKSFVVALAFSECLVMVVYKRHGREKYLNFYLFNVEPWKWQIYGRNLRNSKIGIGNINKWKMPEGSGQ